MNSKVWLSALGALLLGACAHHYPHHGRFTVPDPKRPEVTLTQNGRLVVNQEPLIVLLKKDVPVTVTYRLPPGSGLSFDRTKGVRVLGRIKDDKGDLVRSSKDAGAFLLDTSANQLFFCGPAPAPVDGAAPAGSLGGNAEAIRARLAALASMESKEPVDPQAYVCLFDDALKSASGPRGHFAYEINVVGQGKTFRLDPTWYPDPSPDGGP